MRPDPDSPVAGQVAQAARDSYGRIVAWLARRFGNLADAEDAMSAALESALVTWPQTGVPRSPEAWLLTTARRRMLDRLRHAQTISQNAEVIAHLSEDRMDPIADALPDNRLTLMFVCTHPAIDPAIRAPLMLQTVLGLPSRRIASAFLVPPATMAVNLSRAKAKIAATRVPFTDPDPKDLGPRIDDILEAIYAAYTLGQDRLAADGSLPDDLSTEALWLISILARLAPQSDATHGLFALILFGVARRNARLDAAGCYIPLSEQDHTRWDQPMLADARLAFRNATRNGTLGRYQIEAAIEAAQVDGVTGGRTDRRALYQLYDLLQTLTPTLGVTVARIAALSYAADAATALAALDALADPPTANYQPYWALRAHLLARLDQSGAAHEAYVKAAALTETGPVRAWLLAKAAAQHRP